MPRGECLRLLGFADDRAGWRGYHDYLRWLAANPPEQKCQAWSALSKGWAIGSIAWRKTMRETHRLSLGRHFFSREETARINHEEWSQALAAILQRLDKTLADGATAPKGAPWKLEILIQLRRTTSVTIPWLAAALHMGKPGAVRALLAQHKR